MYIFDVSEIIGSIKLYSPISENHKKLVAFIADGGNHFSSYGIESGDVLIIDRMKEAEKGKLSVYARADESGKTIDMFSDSPLTDFSYVGKYIYNYTKKEAV